MKRTHEIIIIALWCIAIVTTMMITSDTGAFRYLGPVFLFCMIGSIFTVRDAKRKKHLKSLLQLHKNDVMYLLIFAVPFVFSFMFS